MSLKKVHDNQPKEFKFSTENLEKAKNIKTPNKMYFSNEICLSSANNEKVSELKFLSIDFKSKKFKYFIPLTFEI